MIQLSKGKLIFLIWASLSIGISTLIAVDLKIIGWSGLLLMIILVWIILLLPIFLLLSVFDPNFIQGDINK